MSAGPRHRAIEVWPRAYDFLHLLYPRFERAEICGSLRRDCLEVGDIEIVLEPKRQAAPSDQGDLFGAAQPVDLVEQRLAELLRTGEGGVQPHPTDPKNGPRYKKLWLKDPGIQIDLFLVRSPEQSWGAAVAIRTGPAEFSRTMVTALRGRGMRCEGGTVKRLDDDSAVECPDERTFFKLCGRPFMPPAMREGWGNG